MACLNDSFEKFDKENPHVYALYVKYALEAKARGRTSFSIAMITERIRWYTAIETTDPEFKINNNHRAFYARKLMEDPRFQGMFAIRASNADERPKRLDNGLHVMPSQEDASQEPSEPRR